MQSGPIAAFSANAEKNACLQQASIRRAKHTFREVREAPIHRTRRTFRQVPLHHTFRWAAVWRTGPTFSTRCHTPNGAHTSDGLPYAERESVNCLNIVWLPERAFHAESMPCSHNGLLFVSHILCWRRKRRPLKSRLSTPQKKPTSKGSWFPPFENGSAAEAEFAPRRRPLFVPRRRLLKRKTDFLRSRLFRFRMVPEARVELARLSTTVFETAASAIPPLGREIELYPMFPKAQTEISEHAQKATIQAENR